MKRNNWIGLTLFITFLFVEWPQIHAVEAFVLFSILILIPLSFELVDHKDRYGHPFWISKVMDLAYPFAATSAMLAFVFDQLFFAAVWWLFTGIVALLGLRRILERGLRPLGETSIDFGLLYLFLGGFWFFTYVGEWKVMGFSGLIVLLTAIHFHYSAFFLPIFVGLLNRRVSDWLITLIVMISPMTVAIGITYSTTIEIIAVGIYFLALFRYGFRVWATIFEEKLAKWLLVVSATFLMMTITFSLLYAIGTFSGKDILSIQEMIWIHGAVNAIAVILLGVIGWRLETPKPKEIYYGKSMSKIYGSLVIGGEFLNRKGLESSKKYQGLVDQMTSFTSSEFQPDKLSPTIIDFYENTVGYELQAKITWKKWFMPFAYIYQFISRKVLQIHLGMERDWQWMTGEIVGVDSEKDGREDVRAWVRRNEQGKTIFVALYSSYIHQGETYMNIALPLPFSNMTGILRLVNQGNNLVITSCSRKGGNGDEGIYLRTPLIPIKLPLSETFIIKEEGKGLQATHQMWILGLKFLQIKYKIKSL